MARTDARTNDGGTRAGQVGPYREADFDAAFVRTHRSDWTSVAIRAAMLLLVYWLLARAIRKEQLGVGFVLLPLAVEILAVFWIGWIMATWLVRCETFRKSAGSLVLAIFWTLVILGLTAARLGVGGDPSHFDTGQIPANLAIVWAKVRDSGLFWAMLAAAAALVLATIPEILRWRRTGGVFVWTSIMNSGFRLGVMVLLAFVGGLVAIIGAEFVLPVVPEERAAWWPWIAFWFLLVADVLTLGIATAMHRDLGRKAKPRGRLAPET